MSHPDLWITVHCKPEALGYVIAQLAGQLVLHIEARQTDAYPATFEVTGKISPAQGDSIER